MILNGNSKVGEAKIYTTRKEMELEQQLAQQKALLDEAVKVIKIAEHISDEDEADIVMEYARAFLEKMKNGN